MWRRWRQKFSSTAHDVTDTDYVQITNLAASSLEECRKADSTNNAIYKKRLKTVENLAGVTVDVDRFYPPAETNEKRYMRWRQENQAVRADWQAIAVEALSQHNLSVRKTEYDAWMAVPMVLERECSMRMPCDFFDADHDRALEDYRLFDRDTIETGNCTQADLYNQKIYSKKLKNHLKARSQLSGTLWALACTAEPRQPPSNTDRRAKLLGRATLVSAIKQAVAVETLFMDYGMHAGIDYEPQYAQEVMSFLKREQEVVPLPSAPPLYPHVVVAFDDDEEGNTLPSNTETVSVHTRADLA